MRLVSRRVSSDEAAYRLRRNARRTDDPCQSAPGAARRTGASHRRRTSHVASIALFLATSDVTSGDGRAPQRVRRALSEPAHRAVFTSHEARSAATAKMRTSLRDSAEEKGFEPLVGLPPRRFSKPWVPRVIAGGWEGMDTEWTLVA